MHARFAGLARLAVVLSLFAVAITLAGCGGPDYIKMGDSAAASGDWRSAEKHYRTALTEKPNEPGLSEKHANARDRALADARNRAQTLQAGGDNEAALTEVEYALTLAPGDTELVEMRTSLARTVALQKLTAAREAADAGKFDEADRLLDEAQGLTSDAGVVNEANALGHYIPMKRAQKDIADADEAAGKKDFLTAARLLRRAKETTTHADTVGEAEIKLAGLAGPAADEAMRLAGENDHAKAVPLAELAAELDPQFADLAEGIRTIHTDKEQREFMRLCREAATALDMFQWSEAKSLLTDALTHGSSERAKAQLEFANHAIAAQAAIAAKDWATAETELTAALNTGEDPNSWAQMELARVAVKPWRVSLGHLLLSPVDGNGMPWSGMPDSQVKGVADELRKLAGKLKADQPVPDVVAAIEQQAGLVSDPGGVWQIRVTLPDTTTVLAPATAVNGVWSPALGASVVVSANQVDERGVTIEVRHLAAVDSGNGRLVGSVTIRLGELVTKKALLPGSAGILSLRAAITPAEAEEVGTHAGLVDPAAASQPDTPGPGVPDSPQFTIVEARPWPHALELGIETDEELAAEDLDKVVAALKAGLATAESAAKLGHPELADAGRYNTWRDSSTKVEVKFTVSGDIMEYATRVFDVEER